MINSAVYEITLNSLTKFVVRRNILAIVIMCNHFFVADGINSVGDYNSPPGGCRLSVCVCLCVSPLFFTFHDGITSKRFELSG